MFISEARMDKGISVSLSNDPNEPIRCQFGANSSSVAMYFSRNEALDLMSQLEKAIHSSAEASNEVV
jgi:hypothetical protein